MKIALCLSGQPRYLDEGFYYLYENILKKYSVDVFIHTWWDNEMKNKKMDLPPSLSYGRTYFWKEDTIDDIKSKYDPISFTHEPQIEFETFDDVNYELGRPSHVHSMFYSIEKSNRLKLEYENINDVKYDLVIRSRFDVKFNKFDLKLNEINSECINCSMIGFEYPNDQFAISSSQNMDIYSSVFSNLQNYRKSGFKGFIGERLLKHHFEVNDIEWKNTSLKNKLNVDIVKK